MKQLHRKVRLITIRLYSIHWIWPELHGIEQKMGELEEKDGQISVDVEVTNTGDVAGKDVVEVYYEPPIYKWGN